MILLAQGRSLWWFLPRWIYETCSRLYQQEEATMHPIRIFARHAVERAQPLSPLNILRQRPSHALTEKDLLDEAITLLFAGQDTSAATLSWTLHLLSLHPDIQEKAATEVKSVVIEDDDNVIWTKKLVSKMPYLDAVLKESMRLYPVAPFVLRSLPHDVEIDGDDNSTTLRQGVMACIWIYGLHRNPKLWKRPNDFVPERWLLSDKQQQDIGITSGAYMPFAAGPRNCVGQPLAYVILRVVLSKLLFRYRFVDDRLQQQDGDASKLLKEMQAGFTVLPDGGVDLQIQER
jgi:cytochrome P450 family 4